jgi:hypothetical protein
MYCIPINIFPCWIKKENWFTLGIILQSLHPTLPTWLIGADIAGVDIDIAGSIENMKELDRLSKGAYRSAGASDQDNPKHGSLQVYISMTIRSLK